MKTQMMKLIAVASLASLLAACNPVSFGHLKEQSASSVVIPDPDIIMPPPVVVPEATPVPPTPTPVPPTPTPVPPTPTPVPPTPTPVPTPIYSKGACASDSSTRLLSCMTCVVPATPTPEPQFSKKGKALLDIMTSSCHVRNKSDPAGYVPPTRAELLRRLNRLSPVLYPDTPMTAQQVSTINALLTNPNAEKDMFGGLWRSGITPETIAFETYFGIESIEARYAFCYASPSNGTPEGSSVTFTRWSTTEIHSKEYYDCQYVDPFQCRESTPYVAANRYRNQLRNAMTESLYNPYVPPNSNSNPITCSWEKFEGLYDKAADAQLKKWLADGFTVGGDVPSQNMCLQLNAPLTNFTGKITMAAYRCSK